MEIATLNPVVCWKISNLRPWSGADQTTIRVEPAILAVCKSALKAFLCSTYLIQSGQCICWLNQTDTGHAPFTLRLDEINFESRFSERRRDRQPSNSATYN